MGLEEKTISSSGCTGGSAELVSDPNNILFSSHTPLSNVSPFNVAQYPKKTYRWDTSPIQGCRNGGEVPKTADGKQ